MLVESEGLGKDFKLALNQASKIKDEDIEKEGMSLERYKDYINESKLALKSFYKELKNEKLGKESYFETPENYKFYIENDKNDEMNIFYY